ncbi:2397_t:CDS:2 [Racocetra fulgida]|uniref:2397_t:CDS:1 n=1 Tax=Racocetra fulgida TaxID=60492 RepID=A0A9N9FEC5_9GLOM|nr:2397_t:CDS:2 [Racocetra fulgida]
MLHIRNPMSIEDLLDFEEKRMDIHQQFNDNDFIQGAIEIEQVENELDILRNALRIVDERIDDGGITIRSLHKLQSCIREEVRKEEAKKQV